MLGERAARRLCERALSLAARLPGASARVALTSSRGGFTRAAGSQVTQVADTEEATLEVAISFGQRRAAATTNQLELSAVAALVERAAAMAKLTPASPEVLPPLGSQRYLALPGAVDAAAARLGAAARARVLGSALREAGAAGLSLAAFFQHAHRSTSLADSAGLWAHDERTRLGFSCSARSADGSAAGWAGAGAASLSELAPERLVARALAKARASANPARLPPGRYTVVLEPAATGSLVRFLTDSLDARSADEGRSFFSGRRSGERLFPAHVTVRTEPADFAADGRAFDDEGVPQQPRIWIDRGALAALPCDRVWAARRGISPSGWPAGLALDGGAASLDEQVRGVERGLLITRFFYLSLVEARGLEVTGATRDGVLLIERGAVVGAAANFRFRHSPVALLERCDALGPSEVVEIDGGARLRAPVLRSHEFAMTGHSEAV